MHLAASRQRRALVGATRLAFLAGALAGCATPRPATSVYTGPSVAAPAAPAPLVVYVVRHAERADTTRDPSLSETGRARADALAATLRDAGIGAIVTSQYARTRETAAPLAAALGLSPHVVAAASPVAAHADSVARAVARFGAHGAVLVVGHSNTVSAIVAALGGPRLPDLCDADYDNLLVVVRRAGEPARLARARFGAPDADAGCAAMMPL